MADLSARDLAVRSAVYARFAAADVPSASDVAADLAMDVDAVIECYERLAAAHALVLDPDSREVWMAMPFSAVPTAFRVEGLGRQWFANCAWDAFGIAAAMSCDVSIATYCLDCGAAMVYGVRGGELTNRDGVVHFAVPAQQWWDDIGFT
jgi:hypothetical protein